MTEATILRILNLGVNLIGHYGIYFRVTFKDERISPDLFLPGEFGLNSEEKRNITFFGLKWKLFAYRKPY